MALLEAHAMVMVPHVRKTFVQVRDHSGIHFQA
jgi:hypothetical protein